LRRSRGSRFERSDLNTLRQAWDLVALTYQRMFGQPAAIQHSWLDEQHSQRCMIINSWLYLYRARGKWITEIRVPSEQFARQWPCLRTLDRNRSEHSTLDAAIVQMLLSQPHRLVHQSIEEVRHEILMGGGDVFLPAPERLNPEAN